MSAFNVLTDRQSDNSENSRIRFGLLDVLWLLALICNVTYMPVQKLGALTLGAAFLATVINLLYKRGAKFHMWLLSWPVAFLVFFIYVFVSQVWTKYADTKYMTLLSLAYVLGFVLGIGLYIQEYTNYVKMMHIVALSIAYFSVIYLITSPYSTYGTTAMGGVTGQWRNAAGYWGVFGFAIFLLLITSMNNAIFKLIYFVLSILCVSMALVTGSRKVIIMLLLLAVLYALTAPKIGTKIKIILLFVLVLSVAYYFITQVEFLQYSYGDRLMAFFNSDLDDGSIERRTELREYAIMLFKQHPILGAGIDSVRNHLTASGDKGTYSHNNYVELLADFGIIGALIYYFVPVKTAIKSLFNFKKSKYIRFGLIMLVVYLVCDWGAISYSYRLTAVLLTLWISGCQHAFKMSKDNESISETGLNI